MMYREDRGWGIQPSGSGDGSGSGEELSDRLEAIETRLAQLETGKGE